MKITVLNDNVKGKCEGEHGLSYLIEADKKVLFDIGPSDISFKNARKLKVDLREVDTIILSHGHYDHGNGLVYMSGKTLICHPGCFIRRFRKKDSSYVGLPMTLEDAKMRFNLVLSDEPYKVSDDITFLGQIPRTNDFEVSTEHFYMEDKKDDPILDDSALAIKTKKGIVVVTGCSHSGICNIIEYAKKVCKSNKVYAVIGGFHILKVNEVAMKTLEYLKKQKISHLYPSHCTLKPVLEVFSKAIKINNVHSGDIINI